MLDVTTVRSRFPALARAEEGRQVAYLDGPAGTQVPSSVIDAIAGVHRDGVANLGGAFGASRDATRFVSGARAAVADLLGASPNEIAFGQNMTSLTFAVSRALARTWEPGSNVVITTLDHDANRTPWRLAARDRGVEVREADFDPTDGTLAPGTVIDAIDERTAVVAMTAASNALGTVTDLAPVVAAAHAAGAVVFVDAVHYSAHRLSDVHALGTDFLVASAYKFFGPHTGMLYGTSDALDRFEPYKLVPAPDRSPDRWETGTQSFEALAGVTAAVDHLAGLGEGETRRERLQSAFTAIRGHEDSLSERFMAGLAEIPGVHLHGPGAGGPDRVATFAITVDGVDADEVSRRLGRRGIYTWSGHYYATTVMDRLGLSDRGGAVRIGFVHYTAVDEVDRVLEALSDIS